MWKNLGLHTKNAKKISLAYTKQRFSTFPIKKSVCNGHLMGQQDLVLTHFQPAFKG